MLNWLKPLATLPRKGLSLALHFTNHLLIFVLLIQLFIIWTSINQQEVPIPNFVKNKAEQALLQYNLKGTSSNATLYIDGTVKLVNFSLFHSNYSEPLIQSDEIHVEISLLPLLFGKLDFKEIVVKGGTLNCPPTFSPTGINEPVARKIYLSAENSGKSYIIRQFSLEAFNAHIIAEGNLSKSYFNTGNDPFDINSWLKHASNILSNKKYFHAFTDPILSINLEQEQKNQTAINAKLRFKSINWEDKGSTNEGNINMGITLKDNALRLSQPLSVELKNLEWDRKYHVDNFSGLVDVEMSQTPKIKGITAVSNNVTIHNHRFGVVGGRIALDNYPQMEPELYVINHNNEWISGTIKSNEDNTKFDAHVQGRMHFDTIQRWIPQEVQDAREFPDIDGSVDINTQISLLKNINSLGFDIKKIDGTIQSGGLSINGHPFDSVYADIISQSIHLNINNAFLLGEKNNLSGSFSKNTLTGDYRYLLLGRIIPEVLDPWLDDWWPELWTQIKLRGPAPKANIEIKGNSNDSKKTQVYLDATAKNLAYKDVPIDECGLRIFSDANTLEINDLYAKHLDQDLQAYILWDYESGKDNDPKRIIVKGTSSFDISALDKIIDDPDVHDVLNEFSGNETPTLIVSGVQHSQPWRTWFDIDFSSPTPVIYHNTLLDHLKFKAYHTTASTEINDITFGYAQGQGTATALIEATPDGPRTLAFETHLIQMNQNIAIAQLKKQIGDANNSNPKNYQGLIALNLSANGTLGDISSFTGSGDINISEADFGEIYLFGLLSEILSLTPLGLGTFQLTNATSTFTINQDIVHFPDLLIYGPSASIQSKGNLKLSTQGLNFLMDISPMNKRGTPILSQALLLLAPITQSFQVRLKGTLNDPDWQTTLTPFGLFKQKGPSSSQ